MRGSLRIRDADPNDIETVLRFVGDVVNDGAAGAAPAQARLADGLIGHSMRERYARLLCDPEHRVVLAVGGDGAPLGVAVFSVDTISALLAVPVVHVSHVIVPGLDRHRAVGRALVAAAATFAEEIGAEHVTVGVTPTGRETNRFFARLGFAPLVMRRIASVPALRRTLLDAVGEETGAARPVTRRVPLPTRLVRPRLRGEGLAG